MVNILFVSSGAFAGIDKNIRDRSDKSGIGFATEVRCNDEDSRVGQTRRSVEPEDLVKYGLIPEFVGRLPMIATLVELDLDALVRIIREPKNSLTTKYAHTRRQILRIINMRMQHDPNNTNATCCHPPHYRSSVRAG